jgi:hypothetical protein
LTAQLKDNRQQHMHWLLFSNSGFGADQRFGWRPLDLLSADTNLILDGRVGCADEIVGAVTSVLLTNGDVLLGRADGVRIARGIKLADVVVPPQLLVPGCFGELNLFQTATFVAETLMDSNREMIPAEFGTQIFAVEYPLGARPPKVWLGQQHDGARFSLAGNPFGQLPWWAAERSLAPPQAWALRVHGAPVVRLTSPSEHVFLVSAEPRDAPPICSIVAYTMAVGSGAGGGAWKTLAADLDWQLNGTVSSPAAPPPLRCQGLLLSVESSSDQTVFPAAPAVLVWGRAGIAVSRDGGRIFHRIWLLDDILARLRLRHGGGLQIENCIVGPDQLWAAIISGGSDGVRHFVVGSTAVDSAQPQQIFRTFGPQSPIDRVSPLLDAAFKIPPALLEPPLVGATTFTGEGGLVATFEIEPSTEFGTTFFFAGDSIPVLYQLQLQCEPVVMPAADVSYLPNTPACRPSRTRLWPWRSKERDTARAQACMLPPDRVVDRAMAAFDEAWASVMASVHAGPAYRLIDSAINDTPEPDLLGRCSVGIFLDATPSAARTDNPVPSTATFNFSLLLPVAARLSGIPTVFARDWKPLSLKLTTGASAGGRQLTLSVQSSRASQMHLRRTNAESMKTHPTFSSIERVAPKAYNEAHANPEWVERVVHDDDAEEFARRHTTSMMRSSTSRSHPDAASHNVDDEEEFEWMQYDVSIGLMSANSTSLSAAPDLERQAQASVLQLQYDSGLLQLPGQPARTRVVPPCEGQQPVRMSTRQLYVYSHGCRPARMLVYDAMASQYQPTGWPATAPQSNVPVAGRWHDHLCSTDEQATWSLWTGPGRPATCAYYGHEFYPALRLVDDPVDADGSQPPVYYTGNLTVRVVAGGPSRDSMRRYSAAERERYSMPTVDAAAAERVPALAAGKNPVYAAFAFLPATAEEDRMSHTYEGRRDGQPPAAAQQVVFGSLAFVAPRAAISPQQSSRRLACASPWGCLGIW